MPKSDCTPLHLFIFYRLLWENECRILPVVGSTLQEMTQNRETEDLKTLCFIINLVCEFKRIHNIRFYFIFFMAVTHESSSCFCLFPTFVCRKIKWWVQSSGAQRWVQEPTLGPKTSGSGSWMDLKKSNCFIRIVTKNNDIIWRKKKNTKCVKAFCAVSNCLLYAFCVNIQPMVPFLF